MVELDGDTIALLNIAVPVLLNGVAGDRATHSAYHRGNITSATAADLMANDRAGYATQHSPNASGRALALSLEGFHIADTPIFNVVPLRTLRRVGRGRVG